jgi:hypothetical protein
MSTSSATVRSRRFGIRCYILEGTSPMRRLSLLALLSATPSAALAEQTISHLEATARVIQSQLQLSSTLSLGAMSYATTGGVIEGGALDSAQITQQMMDDYNAAIDAVVAAEYANAVTIFMDAHNAAMVSLNIWRPMPIPRKSRLLCRTS